MKNKLLKSGNIKLIIIIFFVLAILGVLGFIFWNNFIKQPVANQSSTTAVKNPLKKLSVSEWSISLSYKNLPDLTYSIIDNGPNQDLLFNSSAITGCNTASLGGITRSSADNGFDKSASKLIGGYVYVYREPNFVDCNDINGPVIQDFVKNIRGIYATISSNK